MGAESWSKQREGSCWLIWPAVSLLARVAVLLAVLLAVLQGLRGIEALRHVGISLPGDDSRGLLAFLDCFFLVACLAALDWRFCFEGFVVRLAVTCNER